MRCFNETMKKFINEADQVVEEFLRGFAAAHPSTHRVDYDQRVILRSEIPEHKVGILSGGGSGHEPLHGGFVGPGMLDAAVCGEVFTSPVPDQIQAATEAVDRGAGVLHIVKNYTGDVMNFEMAAELAEDVRVESVVVADDVAVDGSSFTAGRRGVGGTLFVERLAGAAAEEGRDLDGVLEIARQAAEGARSMGVALTSGTLPARGRPSFDLPPEEMELGVGIHGEPGRSREAMASAREIAHQITDPVLAEVSTQQPLIVLLNGMGATPLSELYLMYGEVAAVLEKRGYEVARTLVGSYVTSLDMAGCSLSVLPVDQQLLRLWDAPVSTPALRWGT